MENFINMIFEFIQSYQFLLITMLVSFIIKLIIIIQLLPLGIHKKSNQLPWLFLLGTLTGALMGDIAWIVKTSRILFFSNLSYKIVIFFIRLAWAFLVIQYQSLCLFVDSLVHKKLHISLFHNLCIGISACVSSYFLYTAFFQFNYMSSETSREIAMNHNYFEYQVMQGVPFYLLFVLIIPALYTIMKKIRAESLPKILIKQIKIVTLFFIIPFFCIELLLGLCFKMVDTYAVRPLIALSTLMLVAAIYYCIKKIMNLRFLNNMHYVHAMPSQSLIDDFKTMLERLSNANSLHELNRITQTFFKEAFNIPIRSISLILREKYQENFAQPALHNALEKFLATTDAETADFISANGVLSYDDLAFDQFYHDGNSFKKNILTFLDRMNADIVVPIFIKNQIIGDVIIGRDTRRECYARADHDAMIVFANYMSNMINLLQNKDLETIIVKEKQLQEDLYQRHQEINQYKESITAFLRHTKQKPIGIIFYKNKQFSFGNQAAQELITIDIQQEKGHPLLQTLNAIAYQVETFKTPYSSFAYNEQGHILILSGMPHLHRNQVIITVMYPEISDIIDQQINLLYNPNDWDYVLYLASTSAGTQINELIPGSGQAILNFKIELLKAALSKRALLLDMPADDLIPTVERLHHISMRETLHVMELTQPIHTDDVAPKLFGSNPLLYKATEQPLLKTLNSNGTLFIKNIHFLAMELQEQLAEFITYGHYRLFDSEQLASSATRIICSTNQDISVLLHNGAFSPTLYHVLKPTLVMPSLSSLDSYELNSLIDGFTDQALKTDTFKNMLALNEKEKERLIQTRPISLRELKMKVQQFLIKKSKEHNIEVSTTFDPAYEVSDPSLTHIARLGKYALKDQKIMAFLWHKFKNQNKIAQFLGVNRSSVYRRFKILQLSLDGKEHIA